ncbi:hypothetical protein OAS39_02335 [Pirellulales bacterium]|nr:hypothetical protein [Pirellulales bacterium]
MRNGKHRKTPVRLARLEKRFASWRKTRKRGERIPKHLWRAAAKLAAEYGLNATAKALGLDYYALKKRHEQLDGQVIPNAPFIALPSALPHASECVIELEDGLGASMRMHLKGGEIPDVLALGRSFWDGGE